MCVPLYFAAVAPASFVQKVADVADADAVAPVPVFAVAAVAAVPAVVVHAVEDVAVRVRNAVHLPLHCHRCEHIPHEKYQKK